jgi:hypothetical protein
VLVVRIDRAAQTGPVVEWIASQLERVLLLSCNTLVLIPSREDRVSTGDNSGIDRVDRAAEQRGRRNRAHGATRTHPRRQRLFARARARCLQSIE